MRKSGNRKHYKRTNHNNLAMFNVEVVVTNHVITRVMERQDKEHLTREEVIKKIKGQVQQSKLIGLKGNEEHRSYGGYIFVIVKEYNKMIVKTLKLSNKMKRYHYNERFDADHPEIVDVVA